MNFGSLEKIESVLLRPTGNFTIKNVVVLGTRDKNGMRRDSLKENNYKSDKYINFSVLGKLTLETSDYLVFSYSDFNDRENNVDIFISYPHIYRLLDIFDTIYKQVIINNGEDIFYEDKKGNAFLKEEYENTLYMIDNLIGNKSIGVIYDTIARYDENKSNETTYEKAITLALNNDNIKVQLSLDTFEYMYRFLKDFNLLTSSQNLYQLAYMNEIAKNLKFENNNDRIIQNGSLNHKRRIVVKKKDKNNEKPKPVLDNEDNAFLDPNIECDDGDSYLFN